MQIAPVSRQTNPNFQALKISNRTLKSLGCSREDILKNEFIRTLADDGNISITSKDGSIFKKATNFLFKIGEPLLEFSSTFKTLDELSEKIDSMKEDYYFQNAIKKYPVEYKIFQSLEKEENISEFLDQMDYIMPSIASIPNTPQYKKINDYFLSVLQKMRFWRPLPRSHKALPETNRGYWRKAKIDTIESTGLRALKNNKLELLKFLKEKGENLNQCLDYIKTNPVSEEAKEILKDVKYQDAKIFEFENPYMLKEFLENNPNIDINSRNPKGDTLVLKAIKNEQSALLHYLTLRDDVNWNAYDKYGQNILMRAVLEDNPDVTRFLIQLPDGAIDLKRCSVISDSDGSSSDLMNPITYMVRNYRTSSILNFLSKKNLDVMYKCKPDDSPLVIEAMEKGIVSGYLEPMFQNASFDIAQKSKDGRSILECVNSVSYNYPYVYRAFLRQLPNIIMNDAKKIYDENGELTLEQIEKVLDTMLENRLNYKSFTKQPSFNAIGDNIGHLLCDTYVEVDDKEKMEALEKVISKLNKYRYDYSQENEIGQTPLSRAIESENYGLIKLLIRMQGGMF